MEESRYSQRKSNVELQGIRANERLAKLIDDPPPLNPRVQKAWEDYLKAVYEEEGHAAP